jgi:hypothetical protein
MYERVERTVVVAFCGHHLGREGGLGLTMTTLNPPEVLRGPDGALVEARWLLYCRECVLAAEAADQPIPITAVAAPGTGELEQWSRMAYGCTEGWDDPEDVRLWEAYCNDGGDPGDPERWAAYRERRRRRHGQGRR